VIRLFVALDLPEEARAALPVVDAEPWRPVRREAMHVTLAFLGSREEEDAARVDAAIRDVVGPVGPLWLGEPILLPPRRPRVMAVELDDPSGESVRLQARIAAALEGAGLYVPERRGWLPHVTIARARGRVPPDQPLPEVPVLELRPPSVSVYRSVPAPGGSRYDALHRYVLV
jgi:2'-5' RNA ligase